MNEVKINLCKNIVNSYSTKIYDELYVKDNKLPIYIINHIYRVCLQLKDKEQIRKCLNIILNLQLDCGGWGIKSNDKEIGVYGITATEIQLLFWTMDILYDEEVLPIKNAIIEGINYLLSNRTFDDYWKEQNETERLHGLLDLNHYILQVLYYAENRHDMLLNHSLIGEVKKRLTNFYLVNQSNDGGWHEIGKIRTREGTTADAIRALLPNKEVKENIQKGIEFLINNQNPHEGYWASGNHDKCYDTMKAIINSIYMFEKDESYILAVERGIDYILTLNKEAMSLEELCDYISVLNDYIYASESSYYMEKYFF